MLVDVCGELQLTLHRPGKGNLAGNILSGEKSDLKVKGPVLTILASSLRKAWSADRGRSTTIIINLVR